MYWSQGIVLYGPNLLCCRTNTMRTMRTNPVKFGKNQVLRLTNPVIFSKNLSCLGLGLFFLIYTKCQLQTFCQTFKKNERTIITAKIERTPYVTTYCEIQLHPKCDILVFWGFFEHIFYLSHVLNNRNGLTNTRGSGTV